MFSVTPAFVALALTASACANVFITSPVATTTFSGGQQATISWTDDGAAPNLSAYGPSTVAIYTGNAIQQTMLQMVTPQPVDVSQVGTLQFTVDPSIGPSGSNYFIRVTSVGLKDSVSPQFNQEAFSAKFTLSNMSGTFNASVQAQVDGQSTAPIGSSLPTPSGGAPSNTGSPASTTSHTSASSKPSAASGSGAAKPSASSGALRVGAQGAGMLAALAAAVALF